jgi:hypothetical protein
MVPGCPDTTLMFYEETEPMAVAVKCWVAKGYPSWVTLVLR